MQDCEPEWRPQLDANPRVSVVICTYNGTQFLPQQLQSILGQTLQPLELVVCDDASADSTVSLLENFRQKAPFPVHVVVNERNLGSTRNFDQALQRASGEFLALCDQDDIWMPEKLAILALALQQNPLAGGVFSDALLLEQSVAPGAASPVVKTQKTLWQHHGFNLRKQEQFAHGGAIRILLTHDVVTGATLMVRRDLRPCWTPIPSSWVHDGWIAWMLVLNSKLMLIPRPLIQYRTHTQQQLGVGADARIARIRRMRQTERARYSRVADQFEDLRRHVCEGDPTKKAVDAALRQKISLLRGRSQLSHRLVSRICYIVWHASLYRRYARGWRSMRKDLFLY